MRITGTDALGKALLKRAESKDIQNVVKLNGSELQQNMKRKASFKGHMEGNEFIPPTGATKRSISLELTDKNSTATVKPQTLYSPYLEYGTRKMSAQPFVRPAFNEQKQKFISDLRRLMK